MDGIRNFCKDWNGEAVHRLLERERDGEYIIIPNKVPCRSCGSTTRFVYSFGTQVDGRYKCLRVCTYCGDSAPYRKLRIGWDDLLGKFPQDG